MKNKIGMVAAALALSAVATGCAGVRGVRISERFGYDPADSTRFVQAALDSGERTLIVDKQAGDWFVRPLRVCGRRDLTIVLEDGARVCAKRGEFKNPYVALLTFDCCTNIVIRGASRERCGFRMWVDDYVVRGDKRKPNAKGYQFSEWRHGLSFLSCSDVTLEHLHSNESGGDGLYVSTSGRIKSTPGGGPICRNFVICDCLFDRNNRQGISVIGVDGFLVEDTVMSNTSGTAPAAGIDFEPNRPHESITGIVMRRCKAIDNAGDGFEFYMNQHDSTSKPMDALFEDCVARGNRRNFAYEAGESSKRPDEPFDGGRITVSRCHFSSARSSGVAYRHRPYSRGSFTLRDSVLENNCTESPHESDLALLFSGHGRYDADSYLFDNVKIVRPAPGRVVTAARRTTPYRGKPTTIHGTIHAVVAGEAKTLTFDDRWNAENSPYVEMSDSVVERVPADLSKVEIVDVCPDRMVEIAHPVFYRSRRSAVFYADRAKEVHFRLQQTLVGKRDYAAASVPIRVTRYGERKPLDSNGVRMPVEPNGAVVAFKVPGKGFYRLNLATGGNGVAILATDVPLAYDVTDGYVNFIAPAGGPAGRCRKDRGELFFSVPSGADFSVRHIGDGPEMVGADLVDPSGAVVRHEPVLADLNMMTVRAAAGGVWTLRTFDPKVGPYEDFNLSLSGVPGWLFVTPEKYWKSARPLMMR